MAKAKSTEGASKKNRPFNRKAFCATFHGSTNLFEKYGSDTWQNPYEIVLFVPGCMRLLQKLVD